MLAVLTTMEEALNNRNLDDLIEVVEERLSDYSENCAQYEKGNTKCTDKEDTCYRRGFENDLTEVVGLLKDLRKIKAAL